VPIRHGAETLSGPVRISAPIDIGRSVVSEVIARFSELNPAISVELILSDGYVDLVGEGVDIALRFGAIADSTLRVRNLGHFRRIVCAAPSYIKAHGIPQSPDELAKHNCLVMRFGSSLDNSWHFRIGKKK